MRPNGLAADCRLPIRDVLCRAHIILPKFDHFFMLILDLLPDIFKRGRPQAFIPPVYPQNSPGISPVSKELDIPAQHDIISTAACHVRSNSHRPYALQQRLLQPQLRDASH